MEDKVADSARMEQALARLDRFNLSRTPNFEPRRGPGVPGFVAASGAPLLFMPIRCGPEAAVLDWLGRVGRDGMAPGLIEGFSQKTLRQWMRRSPGLRSFTVLRHPLARAHAAFRERILSGACPEIRAVLARSYALDMPPPGSDAPLDPARHRTAFLGFLKFLKANLAGQTGVRIDAGWASQSTVLQGFAQFSTPDLVLREDRLDEALAFLAAEVGAMSGQTGVLRHHTPDRLLAMIHDPELEAAARDAYPRDYLVFGFGDWVPPGQAA